jgi:hypothetical protein
MKRGRWQSAIKGRQLWKRSESRKRRCRRAPGVLVGEDRVAFGDVGRVESKRVDVFANMSDEELEAYVNGDRGLEH